MKKTTFIFIILFSIKSYSQVNDSLPKKNEIFVGLSITGQPLSGSKFSENALHDGIYHEQQIEAFGFYNLPYPNLEIGLMKGKKINSFSLRFAKLSKDYTDYEKGFSYTHLTLTYKNKHINEFGKNFSSYLGYSITASHLNYFYKERTLTYYTDLGFLHEESHQEKISIKSLTLASRFSTGLSYQKKNFLIGIDFDFNVLGLNKNSERYRKTFNTLDGITITEGHDTNKNMKIILPHVFWKDVVLHDVTFRIAYIIKH